MITILIQQMLGPLGRALEQAYLNHGVQASLVVLAWMVVVAWGLRGVYRLRRQLGHWVRELLPQYDLDDPQTPEQLLAALAPRWDEAARRVRFVPTKRGLWIQRATPAALRELAGFTPDGIARLITRLTGYQRASAVTVDAPVRVQRRYRFPGSYAHDQ